MRGSINTYRIKIKGIVQGVGFRPFVWHTAHKLGLKGEVFNDTEGVTIIIQTADSQIKNFIELIKQNKPPASRIDNIIVEIILPTKLYSNFSITESVTHKVKIVPISPDLDVCKECLKELFNPNDRRYLYPFINCTNCGPRYTIIKDVPYDRINTTMSQFQMCEKCEEEYNDPNNRRYHAQPNACPDCGPQLVLISGNSIIAQSSKGNSNITFFEKISQILRTGKIIAIKSLGGYHLACDAQNESAVRQLRKRKYREDKPFAVMFPNLETVEEFCCLTHEEKEILVSTPHPIVLLKKRTHRRRAESIAPINNYLGVMLPYTPLHHLIFYFFPSPLVMTSGNISEEPIAFEDEDARDRLKNIADYFLIHNRPIYIRCDDSVVRIVDRHIYQIRRSRGYAPWEFKIKNILKKQILGCGAEQKNTIALGKRDKLVLSQHIGDLKNYQVFKAYIHTIEHLKKLFDIYPDIIAHDLHPEYLSTKYAYEISQEDTTLQRIGIQHHHAHAVSCMVDNMIEEPVIAIVLDGTGYGTDGRIWGGEILLASYHDFQRLGHFDYVKMPGGQAAIDNPWQMGLSYLHSIYGSNVSSLKIPFLNEVDSDKLNLVLGMLNLNLNTPLTSSCGRLFDGVAALIGLRRIANYEGQPAIELEQIIEESLQEKDHYILEISSDEIPFRIKYDVLIQDLVKDIQKGVSKGIIAYKFHQGIKDALVKSAKLARELTGVNSVVLSGGVFMNNWLLTHLLPELKNANFKIYIHRDIPCNDGGISVGQVMIANAKISNQLEG